MSACTCSPCGREFTGLTAFDKHQDVDYSRRTPVVCMDPAVLGMEQNPFGRWGFPGDADSRARLRALRPEQAPVGDQSTPQGSEAAESRTAGSGG